MAELLVNLPPLGEDAPNEAEVSFWYVEIGERIAAGDNLVQMLTDKATFDVPSPAAGLLKHRAAGEGDKVQVGQPLCTLTTE